MKSNDVRLAKVALQIDHFPRDGRPEIALLGRSNVGKSSLLNRLTGASGIARVSKTPGRTREIHFYLVDQTHYLVDLPGLGFAKTGKGQRDHWGELIASYLTARSTVALVLQLVDVRHEPQPVDEVVRLALQQRGLPCAVVLTKGDKLSRGAAQSQIDALRRGWTLGDETPVVLTSSQTGAGIAALQRLITTRIAAHAAPGIQT